MNSRGLLILIGIIFSYASANVLQGTVDIPKLQNILVENLKSKDITSLYFAIRGLKQLNYKLPVLCEQIKSSKTDLKSVEQVYYLTNAAALTSCQNYLNPEVLVTPNHILDKKDATIQELFYAVYALKALGKGTIYDKEDALKNLINLLQKDDSPVNYGYVFALCEHMGCNEWTVQHAAGVLGSADESDARAMYFDGGLPATALLLTTLFRSHAALKKPIPMSDEQRLKFAEYLLTRRSVTTSKGAALLLEAATALADHQSSPISIAIKGQRYVTADHDTIEISISDLIGRPVRGLKPEEVIAQSGTRLTDDVVVLSKQPLTQKDPTTFVLNLSKVKSQYGLYKIALSAGSKATSVNVAVLGDIQVPSVEIGVGDIDGTTSPKTTVISYPNKLVDKIQADHLQKVFLKFSVRDKNNKAFSVQQAFVILNREGTEEEVIFVAEPDHTKTYKVELNVGTVGRHVSSGACVARVAVGDGAAASPVLWTLGHIVFNFPNAAPTNVSSGLRGVGVGAGASGPLPEIRHYFREASPRPARVLSDVCAALCAAPLVLLVALWAAIRPNLGAAPLALSAPLFHLGVAACFGLYACLWVKLDMFTTLRYLLPLALLTFLSGHRLLRTLAANKDLNK